MSARASLIGGYRDGGYYGDYDGGKVSQPAAAHLPAWSIGPCTMCVEVLPTSPTQVNQLQTCQTCLLKELRG